MNLRLREFMHFCATYHFDTSRRVRGTWRMQPCRCVDTWGPSLSFQWREKLALVRGKEKKKSWRSTKWRVTQDVHTTHCLNNSIKFQLSNSLNFSGEQVAQCWSLSAKCTHKTITVRVLHTHLPLHTHTHTRGLQEWRSISLSTLLHRTLLTFVPPDLGCSEAASIELWYKTIQWVSSSMCLSVTVNTQTHFPVMWSHRTSLITCSRNLTRWRDYLLLGTFSSGKACGEKKEKRYRGNCRSEARAFTQQCRVKLCGSFCSCRHKSRSSRTIRNTQREEGGWISEGGRKRLDAAATAALNEIGMTITHEENTVRLCSAQPPPRHTHQHV